MPDETETSDKPIKSILETSYTLLDRVQDPNDKDAWNDFVTIYDQYIYNIIRLIQIPENDANDLCQEIMIKLWKKIPEFAYQRDRGKFRPWLSTIIRNDARKYFNKNKRKDKVIDSKEEHDLDHHIDPAANHDLDRIIVEEWNAHVSNLAWESIKSHFKHNTVRIFELYMEGKSNKEIAESCSIKERSVKTYILRIREHLKDRIDKINKELL